MKFSLCWIGPCLVVVALFSPARAEKTYEYNFQSMYPGPHVLNQRYYKPVFDKIKEKSGGRLVIHYFMSGGMVKPDDLAPAVMNGNLDIGSMMVSYQDALFPHALLFQLPYISPDTIHASELYWKAYQEIPEVKAELDKAGKVLTVWGSDRSCLAARDALVKTPADLKGKRVLVWNGGQVDQIKAWGGVPIQVGMNDIYMALQRGMGDVFLGPLPAIVPNKLEEVTRYISVFPASTLVLVTVMNREAWEELPKDLQDLLMDEFGGEKASRISGSMLYEDTQKGIKTIEAAGCTVYTLTDAELQQFRDADRNVVMDFWVKDLRRLGVKDPEAWIKKAYGMAQALLPAAARDKGTAASAAR